MKSQSALAAKAIKAELKSAFPSIQFSVTSDRFAGGDAVRVSYTDGATSDEIQAITAKFQYGHFDGMTDMYEYSNSNDNIPQAKYVTISRHMSDEKRNEIADFLRATWGDLKDATLDTWSADHRCYFQTLIHREFSKRSYTELVTA